MDNILKLMDDYVKHSKIELLEQIRAEIESEYWEDFDSNTVIADNQIDKIFDKHISELKGENNE